MAGKQERTKPVNGGSRSNGSTVKTGNSSGGRSGGSSGGAGGIIQTVVRWLSLAIAVVEIVAIICYIATTPHEIYPYFIYVFFIFASLMVILSMAGVTGAFIGTRFGFAGDCCWPVGLFLFWQASCLFWEPHGCDSAGCIGSIFNVIALALAIADLILGIVARFI